MEHLKKKFIRAWKAKQDLIDVFDSVSINDNAKAAEFIESNEGELYGIIRTTENEMIQGFEYREGSKFYLIPEPNPIVTYFELARQFNTHLILSKTKLIDELNKEHQNVYTTLDKLNNYFSVATICATFLFISIEAFINLKIREDIEYIFTYKQGEEQKLGKSQIVEKLSFVVKAKNVMQQSTGKAFHVEQSHKFEQILKLKYLRDEIVHTKAESNNSPNPYRPLIVQLLDFNFVEMLESVKAYVNFYEPNLIEECDCGRKV